MIDVQAGGGCEGKPTAERRRVGCRPATSVSCDSAGQKSCTVASDDRDHPVLHAAPVFGIPAEELSERAHDHNGRELVGSLRRWSSQRVRALDLHSGSFGWR